MPVATARPHHSFWVVLGCATVPLLSLILLVVGLRILFDRYTQTGRSMEPTIHKGDLLVVGLPRNIMRGDLIAFSAPLPKREIFLMRAIGLPGDVVELRDNRAVVNGLELVEPYVATNDDTLPEAVRFRNTPPVQVGAGFLFVLGDNRDHANDSRYYGPVKRESVRGRVVLVISRKRGVWRP